MGSYLMHTTQLQEFSITTGGIEIMVPLNAIKTLVWKYGQSKLAWYVDEDINALGNLIKLFVTPM